MRAAVTSALEREAGDAEDAEMRRRRLDGRLGEGNRLGAFLSRPFHDCVTEICADLGLDPAPILAMEGVGGPVPAQGSITLKNLFPGEGRGPDHKAVLEGVFNST